jgi:hypothetical protein
MTAVPDAAERAPLLASLCAGCAAASSSLDAVDDMRAAALGADARAALACGQWTGASGDGSTGEALRFGTDVARAALRAAADPAQVAQMRSSWNRCADVAIDAMRDALREAGTAADGGEPAAVAQARRMLRDRRAMVGNAFVPALDAVDAAAPLDMGMLRARIRPTVATAVRRERRRAEVTASVLGGPLATARADAAERRMAEATIAAAAGAYMQWATDPPTQQ